MSKPRAIEVRWWDGRLVGRLVAPGDVVFAYDDEWLSTGYNLSPLSLPFVPGPQRKKDSNFFNLPGVIADSLPDSWGQAVIQKAFHDRKLGDVTPLKQLAWLGKRCMGALVYAPPFPDEKENPVWRGVLLATLAKEARAVMKDAPAKMFPHIIASGGSVGGARPKALVALHENGHLSYGGLGVQAGALPCIVKFDQSNDGDECSSEHAYSLMAQRAGIDGPRTHLVDAGDVDLPTRRHLLVERFDVLPNGARIHVHTLTGLLERQARTLDYADLARAVVRMPMSEADREDAARKVIRRALFNVLALNDDDHGKNHAFVFIEASRLWKLSPAYDLTFSPLSSPHPRGMAVMQNGYTPEKALLAELASGVGVRQTDFEAICAEVYGGLAQWRTLARENKVPSDFVDRVERAMEHRREAFESEIPIRLRGSKPKRPQFKLGGS